MSYKLTDYDYHLPPENIAQHPAHKRDQSRLMVLNVPDDALHHRNFHHISEYFKPDDVLVVNDTKVFPARLLGKKTTGGKVELFLLEFPKLELDKQERNTPHLATAQALLKSSKRPKVGSTIHFNTTLTAEVLGYTKDGKAEILLHYFPSPILPTLEAILNSLGQVPLPPYITREKGTTKEDQERYQTKYAHHPGSVAAPTAGLHFSDQLLESIAAKGVAIAKITLHVGYGTFAPVRTEDIRDHTIHHEYISVNAQTAATINAAKKQKRRIWAVGTTSVRTLEFCTDTNGEVQPTSSSCDLFIYPGYQFKTVDNLITNFHLPQSSLLFLVSALAGREKILNVYNIAVKENYRFFSYGDAMAIITKK
ncbi:MAG: tRNA preQ1(34) S-adenosylmethionine ribosyltransferase-isomerase QueA [Desulfobacterales bacterium]|nr:MAG: tRNA preQ1(34) S-adenosylmethionine ribosyltransferase-isomerase QueA [Desulfobacterales bacterium]